MDKVQSQTPRSLLGALVDDLSSELVLHEPERRFSADRRLLTPRVRTAATKTP